MEEQNAVDQDALKAKREAQNRRKQAQRDRDKIKKQEKKEIERAEKREQEEIQQHGSDEWGIRDVQSRKLCFLGQHVPGCDANTIHQALFSCRRFAKAMKEPDIVLGESLKDFESRIFQAWKHFDGFKFENSHHHIFENGSAPFLCMETGKLEPGWGGGMFKEWVFLPDADKVLTLEQIQASSTL